MTETPETLDFFGIVELLGHKKLAGRVTQVAIGSTAMLRIDVPDTQAHKGYTKYVGVGSVYAMTPTEEALMQRAAEQIERLNEPIPVYIPVQRQLAERTYGPVDDGLSDELHGHEDLDDEGDLDQSACQECGTWTSLKDEHGFLCGGCRDRLRGDEDDD